MCRRQSSIADCNCLPRRTLVRGQPVESSALSKTGKQETKAARSEAPSFMTGSSHVCVFVYLADALQTGDLYVVGAETFADYRAQLLLGQNARNGCRPTAPLSVFTAAQVHGLQPFLAF